MQLHRRGVELMSELLEAADHIDQMTKGDVEKLLRETAQVLGDLLARDKPEEIAPSIPSEATRQ